MNSNDPICPVLQYHEHRCAFIDTFIAEKRRKRWFSLTANRPNALLKSPPKLLQDLEDSLSNKRDVSSLDDESRIGVYYNFQPDSEPLLIPLFRAVELSVNEDAMFYLVPGRLAYFFHDGFVMECKSEKSAAQEDYAESLPTEEEIAWKIAWKKICKRVKSVTSRNSPIVFSNYKTDKNGVPIDNLDDVAIRGNAVIVAESAGEIWGGPKSKPYESEVLTKPTWLDLCAVLHEQIKLTRDRHHVCIEGVQRVGQKTIDGKRVSKYRLLLGS